MVAKGALPTQASWRGRQWEGLTPSKKPKRFDHCLACDGMALAREVALSQSLTATAMLRSFLDRLIINVGRAVEGVTVWRDRNDHRFLEGNDVAAIAIAQFRAQSQSYGFWRLLISVYEGFVVLGCCFA